MTDHRRFVDQLSANPRKKVHNFQEQTLHSFIFPTRNTSHKQMWKVLSNFPRRVNCMHLYRIPFCSVRNCENWISFLRRWYRSIQTVPAIWSSLRQDLMVVSLQQCRDTHRCLILERIFNIQNVNCRYNSWELQSEWDCERCTVLSSKNFWNIQVAWIFIFVGYTYSNVFYAILRCIHIMFTLLLLSAPIICGR